jgi:hypothetical protein
LTPVAYAIDHRYAIGAPIVDSHVTLGVHVLQEAVCIPGHVGERPGNVIFVVRAQGYRSSKVPQPIAGSASYDWTR